MAKSIENESCFTTSMIIIYIIFHRIVQIGCATNYPYICLSHATKFVTMKTDALPNIIMSSVKMSNVLLSQFMRYNLAMN